MERAVVGGLRFIQESIAPEVIITQNQHLEDSFFWNGLSAHKYESGVSHIMLPTVSENLMWIALLRSNALKGKSCYIFCPNARLSKCANIINDDSLE